MIRGAMKTTFVLTSSTLGSCHRSRRPGNRIRNVIIGQLYLRRPQVVVVWLADTVLQKEAALVSGRFTKSEMLTNNSAPSLK